jgi:hypothetical protein
MSTVTFLSGVIAHNSFFSSAQAIKLPLASKYMPFARPAGCMNVDSLPSTLHSRMRSFGWSVKKTLPLMSHVGPSVNWKSPASFSSFAPGAMTLSATTGEKPARPKQIHPARRINGFFAIIRNNLRQSKN